VGGTLPAWPFAQGLVARNRDDADDRHRRVASVAGEADRAPEHGAGPDVAGRERLIDDGDRRRPAVVGLAEGAAVDHVDAHGLEVTGGHCAQRHVQLVGDTIAPPGLPPSIADWSNGLKACPARKSLSDWRGSGGFLR